MNILYFDQGELWSPSIEDLDVDLDSAIESGEFCSISKSNLSKGLVVYVSIFDDPEECFKILID